MITALVNGLGHANVRVMFADAKPATMSLRFTSAEPPSP
jgi:hypothetical protein